MRNPLLLLGESPSGTAASAYARRLARSEGTHITALTGVDLSFIEAPMPGVIGGAAYQARMQAALKTQAQAARRSLAEAFERDCANDGIVPRKLNFEGDPFEQVTTASATCDLVVTGHDVTFSGTGSDQNSDMLSRLLHATPRPVLVCPDAAPSDGDVLVAYDGSLPAMRALQLFVLIGCWRGRRVSALVVDADTHAAERLAGDVSGYLRLHGYEVAARPVTSTVQPSEVIGLHMDGQIELLVMGAYGRRGLREFIFGSTTANIVGTAKSCIFLYH